MEADELATLTRLVETYLAAYDRGMGTDGDRRLWSSSPVRAEYQGALAFLTALPQCRDRYSTKRCEDILDNLLREVLLEDGKLEKEVLDLSQLLAHPLKTHLYVPIDGVEIEAPSYNVGALRLVRMDEAAFEELIIVPYANIMRVNPHHKGSVDELVADRRKKLAPAFVGRAAVEVPTEFDIENTFKFADPHAIGAACDFLQLAASIFMPHDPLFKIQWATQARYMERVAFAESDGPEPTSTYHTRVASVLMPFLLDPTRLAKMSEAGLDRLADLVAEAPKTEFDWMLQTAVRLFAKGEREDHIDDRKIAYVTAVDLFFSKPGSGATQRLCKGFALVLSARPWR